MDDYFDDLYDSAEESFYSSLYDDSYYDDDYDDLYDDDRYDYDKYEEQCSHDEDRYEIAEEQRSHDEERYEEEDRDLAARINKETEELVEENEDEFRVIFQEEIDKSETVRETAVPINSQPRKKYTVIAEDDFDRYVEEEKFQD